MRALGVQGIWAGTWLNVKRVVACDEKGGCRTWIPFLFINAELKKLKQSSLIIWKPYVLKTVTSFPLRSPPPPFSILHLLLWHLASHIQSSHTHRRERERNFSDTAPNTVEDGDIKIYKKRRRKEIAKGCPPPLVSLFLLPTQCAVAVHSFGFLRFHFHIHIPTPATLIPINLQQHRPPVFLLAFPTHIHTSILSIYIIKISLSSP